VSSAGVAVVADRVPGKYERLWRVRHERDLELCRRPGGHPKGLRFDQATGDRAVHFIEKLCKHHKGEWAGKPLLLTDLQRDIISQIFGWLRPDGTRRYRTAYIEVPRKFGKSTVAGGLGLYLTVADGEKGAEVYSSATKKDQAAICWKDAAAMVKASPELKRFVKVMRGNINCERMGSKFEPLGADSSTMDGLNPHGNIVDELHAHKDRGVWDVLDTAMGARRQPLTLAITTAGVYDAEAIGWQIHDYATKVLEGIVEDDSFFAFIAAADDPPADQPDYYFTEAAQRQANPGYGVSPKADYLAKQAEKAKSQPSFYNAYLQLHLNVWTRSVTRWLSLERWGECELPAPDVRAASLEREKSLEGKACFGGLDLSSKLDLSALALVFGGPDGTIDVLCRFWLPEATVAAYSKKGQRHYDTWEREGWLTVTPGDVIDYEFIRSEVLALSKRFSLQELAFDPWGATDLATRIMGDGVKMVETRQGYKSLSEPSKDLEARVVSKKLRHMNNPVLRFCASNAVVTTDSAGNIKPDKEKASDRIDGVVATVMALSRLIAVGEKRGSLLLESGGLLL
jgi:phage terminase large subunit-like protein